MECIGKWKKEKLTNSNKQQQNKNKNKRIKKLLSIRRENPLGSLISFRSEKKKSLVYCVCVCMCLRVLNYLNNRWQQSHLTTIDSNRILLEIIEKLVSFLFFSIIRLVWDSHRESQYKSK